MEIDAISFKCPSCGAGLTFDTETQSFCCEYCQGRFTKEQLDEINSKAIEDEFTPKEDSEEVKKDKEDFNDNNKLYVCPSCGASVVTDSELSASAMCHYCHNPIVLSGRLSGEYRPDKIIPFKMTKDDALKGFERWTAGKKFFLAKGFASKSSLEKIQGIYVPFWLADSCVEGDLVAECFKTISRTRSGNYITVKEEKFLCERKGSVIIRGVPADGSSKADDKLMESIEPFDYSGLVDFNMAYLSGHNAEKYDVTKEQVYPRISERVINESKTIFNKTLPPHGRMNSLKNDFKITNMNWDYAMLPMWFLSYMHKGKMYYYAMNGQTGKFGGKLPVNKLKLALFSFGIPALVMLVIAFFAGIGGIY